MRELIEHDKIWAVNGDAGLPPKPLFQVQKGRAVKLLLDNSSPWAQCMHLHGHRARLSGASHPMESGAVRDTVLLRPRQRVTLEFTADNPGRWLLASSILDHQSSGVVTWFEVL